MSPSCTVYHRAVSLHDKCSLVGAHVGAKTLPPLVGWATSLCKI